MNTWAYLILIAALLLLAATMLYARFASRSREKSLHHSPVELMFPYDTISAARPLENETGKIDLPRSGRKIGPEIKIDRVMPAVSGDEGTGEAKKRESDYFDELQEAAAGLAMLMRSSPAGRTEPVIYAPEEAEAEVATESGEEIDEPVSEDEALVEEVADIVEPVPGAETLVEEVETLVQAEAPSVVEVVEVVEVESVFEETVAAEVAMEEPVEEDSHEGAEVTLPMEVRVLTMREILGDQVSDRIDQIDAGLDALEALVRSIESSLRALDSVDLFDEEEEIAETDGPFVSEAA